MRIDWPLLTYPFRDPKWPLKFLIGMGVMLAGILFFPLAFPLRGYLLRAMRSAQRGEDPALPDWNEWGELFKDGLKAWVVGFLYALPVLPFSLLTLISVFSWMPLLIVPEGFADLFNTTPEAVLGIAFALMTGGMLIITVVSPVMIVLSLLIQYLYTVGINRFAASGSLSDALRLGEVWRLGKVGFKPFISAMFITFAISYGMSYVSSILIYTIVLICLYPLLIGATAMYIVPLSGTLYGTAYRLTLEKDRAALPAGTPAPEPAE